MALTILQIILLAGAIQGACLAFLLYTREENRLANRILSLLIIIVSFQIVLVGFDNREFFMEFPHLSKISWLLPTLFGPLLFLFTQKLLRENPHLKLQDAIHLLPFMLYLVLLSPYFFQSAETKRQYLDNFELSTIDDFGLLNQFTNGLHLFYSIAALLLISRHQKRILQIFSELRTRQVRWLKDFISLAFLTILFGTLVFYARKWNIPMLMNLYHYHYLLVVMIIYWIGYKALSQPLIFNNKEEFLKNDITPSQDILLNEQEMFEKNSSQGSKYIKSGLQGEEGQTLQERILEYMEVEKPFLQNDINLQDLASKLGISKHHLSQVLNERLGQNFYTFINSYRVEEAKKLLIDPSMSHYNTLVIAMEAGFNSKSTFNAVFKKLCGMTPTAFVTEQNKRSELIGRDEFSRYEN